jgi:KaiC/GvpD/RAD55 family RecA-like ATPase
MNKLITKALNDGRVDLVIQFNKELLNPVERKFVEWIAEYHSKYGVSPSMARFKSEFTTFVEVPSTAPLQDIFDTEMGRKKNFFFRQLVTEMEDEIVDGLDPTDLIKRMHTIFSVGSSGLVSSRTYDRSHYFDIRDIVPYFVPFLDRYTGGVAKGDLAWVTGRPGSKKTTFVESMIKNWVAIGMRVLYVSNENGSNEVMPKLDGFFGGFNPINYRLGNWDEESRMRVHAAEYLTSALGGSVELVRDPVQTTAEIEGYIRSIEPDIVIIDGTYLMSERRSMSGDWRDQAEISRNLKKVARRTRTPIIGVIQASRAAEGQLVKRDMLAGTDAYLQDGDTIISINIVDGVSVGQIIKSRWGMTPYAETFYVDVDFAQMKVATYEEATKLAELEEVEDW